MAPSFMMAATTATSFHLGANQLIARWSHTGYDEPLSGVEEEGDGGCIINKSGLRIWMLIQADFVLVLEAYRNLSCNSDFLEKTGRGSP